MQIGLITVDGRQIGIITQSDYTPDLTMPLLSSDDMPMSAVQGEDLGGHARLGHKHGFYPGAHRQEHHATRLGHKHGFYPKTGSESGEGAGAPQPILDKARDVALHGGAGAVEKFMAQQGYPKDGNWCGEFAASVVHAAGGTPPKGAAVASNWRKWGTPTDHPVGGDMAIRRGTPTGSTGSHVTIVEGYDPKTGRFTGIGGNQGAFERSFPAGQYEFRHGTSAPAVSTTGAGGKTVKGSWFDDKSTASGVSAATMAGIALPNRNGLGKMHAVTGPNGQTVMLPQIDVGPAAWTGRGIDISKAALSKLGYTPENFPTDAHFSHRPAQKDSPMATHPMFVEGANLGKGGSKDPSWGAQTGAWRDMKRSPNVEDRRAIPGGWTTQQLNEMKANKIKGDLDRLKEHKQITPLGKQLGYDDLPKPIDTSVVRAPSTANYPSTIQEFRKKFGRDPETDSELEFYNK